MSPRIYRELKAKHLPVSKERVRRLMKQAGLKARHKRRYKVTTDSQHSLPVMPNLLNRAFDTARPDQVRTTDITYILTQEGWLYAHTVLKRVLPVILLISDTISLLKEACTLIVRHTYCHHSRGNP